MSTLEQLQYGFDRDSRRVWRQRTTTQGWDNAYVYDSLSQVIGDDRGDLNQAHNAIAGIPANGSRWQYDETGNWHGYETLANGAATPNQVRTHDKGNRLMEVSDAAAMRTDRAGRMLETVPGPNNDWNSEYQITWDAWSRIVKAEAPAEEMSAEYAYDGMARRITRSVAGQPMVHSYYNDEWRPLEDRHDSETTAAASYLWGSRHRDDLVRSDRAVSGTTLNESRYILMDYFSPAAITDEDGAVTERYQFSAFGLRTILNPDFTVRSDSECGMEFSFQGQFEDMQTGWRNYGYRYYFPALGRWACKDPIMEEGGFNLYANVGNSPTNLVDHLGLYDYGPIYKEIDKGGRQSLAMAEKDLKERQKEYDKLPPAKKKMKSRPEEEIEFCGRVCRAQCGTEYYYYRTGPVSSGLLGECDPTAAPRCSDGDITVGVYHNHPRGNMGMSGFDGDPGKDKKVSERGKPVMSDPQNKTGRAIPPMTPMGATSNSESGIKTNIYNPKTGYHDDL